MENSKLFKKSLIYTSILVAFGTHAGLVSATEYGANNSNFSMLGPAPDGGAVGGTNLVKVVWDGSLNTAVNTAVVNMTISSPAPFFGSPWSAHDVKVYGPGTYVIEACPPPIDTDTNKAADGSIGCPASAQYTMVVGAGQVGAHMLFDWNGSPNIDVINVWDVNAVWAYGPNDTTTTNLLQPADTECSYVINKGTAPPMTAECQELFDTQWLYTSTDIDGDGTPGAGMIDGPFKNFNANFNIRAQAVFDDTLTTAQNATATTVALMANDQLPTTYGAGTFIINAFDATTVQGGSVADNGNGTFNYTPPVDYMGQDSFTYRVDDGIDHNTSANPPLLEAGHYSATAQVIIDVVSPIPTLADDSATTYINEAVTTGDVFVNDSFPPTGSDFAISAFDATSVNGGTVVNNGDNTLTYTPAADYLGTDSFTYTVDDGLAHLATATVNIDILDPFPVLTDDSAETTVNKSVTTVNVLTNDVFPDYGEVFTINAFDATSVEGGSVVNNGDNTFTYTPAKGFKGADSFTYSVDDGKAHGATATVNVEVKAGKSSSSGSLFVLPLMLLLLPLRLFSRKK